MQILIHKFYIILGFILFFAIDANALSQTLATTLALIDSVANISQIEVGVEELSLDEDAVEDSFNNMDTVLLYGEFPAQNIYKIWDNHKVNPYGVRLVGMTDTMNVNLVGYYHPMINNITSNFGFRKSRHHYGIDIKLNIGDTVFCAFDGKVRIAQRSRTYGYFVVVRHYNGLETVYAHLSKLLVASNQLVKAGEAIGKGGSTGRSTGPHLHYELRYLGVPINPNDVIDFTNNITHNDTLYINATNFEYIKEIEKIRYWTVKKGQTLGYISQKTGISINVICQLNKITRKTIIRPGQKIRYT